MKSNQDNNKLGLVILKKVGLGDENLGPKKSSCRKEIKKRKGRLTYFPLRASKEGEARSSLGLTKEASAGVLQQITRQEMCPPALGLVQATTEGCKSGTYPFSTLGGYCGPFWDFFWIRGFCMGFLDKGGRGGA